MNQTSVSSASNCQTEAPILDNYCISDVKWGQASYLWTIKHFQEFYSETREYLQSTVFSEPTHPEYKWSLQFFIDSTLPEFKDYYGVFVSLETDDDDIHDDDIHDVFVKMKFSLLDGDGNEAHVRELSKIFGITSKHAGFSGFILKNTLLDPNPNNKLYANDTITLLCRLKFAAVFEDAFVETTLWSGMPSTVIENNLPKSLNRLLRNQDLVDVTFSVNGKNFGAHKTVLVARSPVFQAMFKHDTQENRLNEVNISDISSETFEEFLQYLYTDKTPDPKMAIELLVVAEKYQVDGLKLLCEEVISKNVSVDNAIELLGFADLHHAERLKKQVQIYIKMNPVNIMSTQSWKNAILAHPHLFDLMNGVFDGKNYVTLSEPEVLALGNPRTKRRKKISVSGETC